MIKLLPLLQMIHLDDAPRASHENSLLRTWDGPLTRELALQNDQLGLPLLPQRLAPETTTTMVCGFCSTGCGLKIHLREGEAINVSPDTSYPVNLGMACPKGWEGLAPLSAPDRATTPLFRDQSTGEFRPIDWHQAAEHFRNQFQSIQAKHGPESVAFLSTGQIATEEMFLLGAVAKFGFGFLHGDSNTRQCMATAATAYKQSLGFDAPPYTYSDFEESDLLVFVGANPCIAHPILWERVLANRRQAKIVVIDPRQSETAQAAHLHLAIRPKSDQTFFYGITRLLIERGWMDRDYIEQHTSGYAEFQAFLEAFTLERLQLETGLTLSQIEEFARLVHQSERTSFWWTMGVNQSYQGVRTAQSIINLALVTGNFGRPGTGANSITGQCNAMGSRLFSNTSALAGGRDFTREDHRHEVAKILGIDAARIPSSSGMAYDEILDAVRAGKIRGLWIIATNTAHSWIEQAEARQALAQLDFLVVQDIYTTTETAQLAHLILPAAPWGEKEGTFINSERRVGRIKRVQRSPGSALADFSIFRLLAKYWGGLEQFEELDSPAKVFAVLQELSRGRPCDITGIRGYQHLDEAGGIQWPWTESDAAAASRFSERPMPIGSQQRRLFSEGKFFHPDGRAKLLFDAPRPMPEQPNAEFPLLLLTGRGSVAQWHTQTRTSKSAVLRKLYPADLYIEIHPEDAERLGITHACAVRVRSRRATIVARACVVTTVAPGTIFAPMHYAAVNQLTLAHYDPHSRQPSYKDCAVRVDRMGEGL